MQRTTNEKHGSSAAPCYTAVKTAEKPHEDAVNETTISRSRASDVDCLYASTAGHRQEQRDAATVGTRTKAPR